MAGGILGDVYGSKPSLPPWHTLNLGQEQQTAINNNAAAAPGAANLANLTEDQIMSMLRKAIPNWDAISGTASSNIESMLKGEIPTDVSNAVKASAASGALFGGYGGTGLARNLTARDLGLTSLNLTEKGLSMAETWTATSERLMSPAMAAYSSMFVTPGEQANFDVNERNMKFEHDWLGSQISAMPDPGVAGIMHQFDGSTILGRNAPQQTGQQMPSSDPAQVAGGGGNDWASGWESAGANDWNITSNAMATGATDASVAGAADAGSLTGLEGILGSGF